MIKIQNISLSFGRQQVLHSVSCTLQPAQKIGLVGDNGAGKSTLLKVISGEQKPDTGCIEISNGFRIASLPQEVVLTSEKTIFDEVFTAYSLLAQWRAEEQILERTGQIATARYAELHALLAEHDYGARVAQTEQVLQGLGFTADQWHTPVKRLSVGWQMRVVLAQLLLQEADFYLFDEPTNHLDLPAKEWFCSFLQQSSRGYVLISHDRYFLDHGVEQIIEIERGNLTAYNGTYTIYVAEKERRLAANMAAYVAQQKEIVRKKKTIERFRSKATKAKMVQSMIKDLGKMEVIQAEHTHKSVSIPLPLVVRAGRVVLTVNNLKKSFGANTIFSRSSFEVMRGQKIALIAQNGKGKTTLLNCLMGVLEPDEGTFTWGHQVTPTFFEQEQVHVLDPRATVLEEVEAAACPEMRPKVRTLLGCFLFSGDDVYKKTVVLSGGERNRVAMAKVLSQQANVLLLDEPTNHLDLRSKDLLLQALRAYQGTIIFVSHDRDFIQHLATSILSLEKQKVTCFPGTYEQFLFHYKQTSPVDHSPVRRGERKASQNKKQRVLRRQLAKIEQRIAVLEKEKALLEHRLGVMTYGSQAYEDAVCQYKTVQIQLVAAHEEWESCYLVLNKER